MEIVKFTATTFAKALSNPYTPVDLVRKKKHYKYFLQYLTNPSIGAQMIVIEEEYISKDFFEDYTSYYALCFAPYPKFCRRVHLFKNKFTQKEFENILLAGNKKQDLFFKNYLGFIVVKPIPNTNIGYTVLKFFPAGRKFNGRNFWGTRDYSIHVFGKEIKINSLAFQEQDNVLAACATAAIWSMLNKASLDFHTILKSPSEITKDAGVVSSDGSRMFPNKGLDILQISQAIVNSGLVPEIKQPDMITVGDEDDDEDDDEVVSNLYLKKILNAYAPIGIPIILVVSVPFKNKYGLHAITATGFVKRAPRKVVPKNKISFLSENIQKFYAHDDQWGPFVRVNFKNLNEITTTWTEYDRKKLPTYVKKIIVPLYPKIRISYEDIEAVVLGIDRVLSFMFENKITDDLVWDVRIDYSEKYKGEIKVQKNLDEAKKIEILTKNMPKYIWIASCYIGSQQVIDFTFDATNVSSGMHGLDIIVYVDGLKDWFREYLIENKHIFLKLFNHRSNITYYDFMLNHLKK